MVLNSIKNCFSAQVASISQISLSSINRRFKDITNAATSALQKVASDFSHYAQYRYNDFIASPLAHRMWKIAIRVKNYVFRTPFVRSPEEQQLFNEVSARYRGGARPSVISPAVQVIPTHLPLTTTRDGVNDPKQIVELRRILRAFLTSYFECLIESVESKEVKRILTVLQRAFPALCDIVVSMVCQILQNISFENVVDGALTIVNDEAKFHGIALKECKEELKRIAEAKKIVKDYDEEAKKNGPYRKITKDQYDQAQQFLNGVDEAGKGALHNKTFTTCYQEAIEKGESEKKAIKLAKQACKELDKDPAFKDNCQEAYIESYYVYTFKRLGGLTSGVSVIISANGKDNQGSEAKDIQNYLLGLSEKIANEVVETFKSLLSDAVFPASFWFKYLPPLEGLEVNQQNEGLLASVLKPHLAHAVYLLLQQFANPAKLSNSMAAALVSVEDQMLFQLFQGAIKAHWEELSPLLYALEIAKIEDRPQIERNIFDKLKNWVPEKDKVLKDISDERLAKSFNRYTQSYLKQHRVIRETMLNQKDNGQFKEFTRHLYELFIACDAYPEEQKEKKRKDVLADLKASILVMLPQSLQRQGTKLCKGSKDEHIDTFNHIVSPLIADLEKALKKQIDNTDKTVDETFIKDAAVQFLTHGTLKKCQAQGSDLIGDLVFRLAFDIGSIAPNTASRTKFIPGGHSLAKSQINGLVGASIAPYRASHRPYTKSIIDSIASKFFNEQRTEVDKQKIKEILFKKPKKAQVGLDSDDEYVSAEEDEIEQPCIDKELKRVGNLSYGLTKQVSPAIEWILKNILIGNNPGPINEALDQIYTSFITVPMIDLSRTGQLTGLIVQSLKEAREKIAALKAQDIA